MERLYRSHLQSSAPEKRKARCTRALPSVREAQQSNMLAETSIGLGRRLIKLVDDDHIEVA